MEQPGLELAPIWDAGLTGGSFTLNTMMPMTPPTLSSKGESHSIVWKCVIFQQFPMNEHFSVCVVF